MCCILFPPFLLLPALCLIYIYIFFAFRGRYLNTRTHAASAKQAIIRKEWSKCVGCKLHCGIALQDGGMSIEEAAIFLNTSFIVLCGELRGGQCHCIYMFLSGRGCICLSLSGRVICRSLGNTGCAQNGNMSLAIILNPS